MWGGSPLRFHWKAVWPALLIASASLVGRSTRVFRLGFCRSVERSVQCVFRLKTFVLLPERSGVDGAALGGARGQVWRVMK